MTGYTFECLRTYDEFQSVRDDWEEFTHRCFPENYSRTHAWLSAFWTSYHYKKPALIYIQRRSIDGKIVAAGPMIMTRRCFGGFPVFIVQALGAGMGCDDFLVSADADGFVTAVLEDLVRKRYWHVANFRRVLSAMFRVEVNQTCHILGWAVDCDETDDFYIDLPSTYEEFLKSRTTNFRRNLRRAVSTLESEGTIAMEVLNPIVDSKRVQEIGSRVAANSWQFKKGTSHFNDKGGDTFYANLVKTGRGIGGEEFTALLVNGRPVAYLLGCRRGRTYFAVDTAYDENYRHVSVGRVLLARIIERLILGGEAKVFEFEGSGEYKNYYASGARKAQFITIYNRSLYPRCIRLIRRSGVYSTLKEVFNHPNREVLKNA